MTHSSNPPEFTSHIADDAGAGAHSAGDSPGHSSPTGSHTAYFYSSDTLIVSEIAQRLGAALAAGGAAVAIATHAHRDGFEAQLRSQGLDPGRMEQQGRWLALDAEETLAAFMVEGWPDGKRFAAVIGGLLDRMAGAIGPVAAPEAAPIAAYGEMVSVLWEEGKMDAAIRLEELWNELAQTRRFHLWCGWPLRFFSRDVEGMALKSICAEHNHVVPGQGYEGMSDDERRRNAVVWQMKVEALEEQTRQSRRTQQTLQLREAELRDLLENAVIGMHWLAPDGTILWVNRAELALLGYQAEEYVGRPFGEFVDDESAVPDMLRRLRANENLRGCEVRMRSRDGSLRWVRIDANPWLQNGELLHARCFVLDITEKKRADEAQMRLAAIVESSGDAIVSKDLSGTVTSWNAAAERIFGYTAEEMVGKSITTVIPPELHQDEDEILRRIKAGERIEHFETVRVTKSGERIDASLTISPVRDPEGRIVGAAKILRDVTAQKKLEAALRTTERLASVGRLAATVAHEINNPLEAVTNLIYLARQDANLPDSVRACLTVADEELQRVSHIARQTLGFYRDTSLPVSISVPEAVDEMVAIYDRRLCYKQIDLRRRIDPGLRLCALQGEFKQIVSNLISNAIHASPQGSAIEVRAWQSCHPLTGAPGVHLVVADRGAGMAESIRTKIFTPFFTTKKDVGTGLGLWIVKGMLLKTGGYIRCRSHIAKAGDTGPNSGTVMMVFIPDETKAASEDKESAAA
jgi:PAS domain S-box-containing protein